MDPHHRPTAHGRKHGADLRRQMLLKMNPGSYIHVDRVEPFRRPLQRAEKDLLALQPGKERFVAVADPFRPQLGQERHFAAPCAINAEGVQLAPVEDDVMAVLLLNGKGQGQGLQAIGDSHELFYVQFRHG